RLDRLSAVGDPDAQRAWDRGLRADVPGDHLEALHGVGDRVDADSRLPDGAVVAGLAHVHAWSVRRRGDAGAALLLLRAACRRDDGPAAQEEAAASAATRCAASAPAPDAA